MMYDGLISLCTPCMNRLDDLIETMPHRIAAANVSPPVEIVIVNYNSTDGMEEYMHAVMNSVNLVGGSFWTYRKYTARNYYHAAHANNIMMTLAIGKYVVAIPADVYVGMGLIPALRWLFSDGCVWCTTRKKHRSSIAILKDEFLSAGGYDERFELYGPDDRDIIERLERRGEKHGWIPDDCFSSIFTPADKKIANYRTSMSHHDMSKLLMPIYYDNKEKQTTVANLGQKWGSWE